MAIPDERISSSTAATERPMYEARGESATCAVAVVSIATHNNAAINDAELKQPNPPMRRAFLILPCLSFYDVYYALFEFQIIIIKVDRQQALA